MDGGSFRAAALEFSVNTVPDGFDTRFMQAQLSFAFRVIMYGAVCSCHRFSLTRLYTFTKG